MRKRLTSICTLLLALVLVMPVMAASKSKYAPLTKKYKNASLEQVLNDIEAKTGYKLAYVADDLDMNQRVTMNFKETPAKSVLKKVLDKNRYDLTSKKGVITIAKKPQPPVTYEVKATTPSEVKDDSLMIVQIWQDTTYSVACKTVTKEVKQEDVQMPEPTSKGHYVQAFLGAAYSSLGYKLTDGKNYGGFGGTLQAQYAYFFHENWGVTAGLGFSGYSSKGKLNTEVRYEGQKTGDMKLGDTPDGNPYNHIARAHDWSEKQASYMVDVPIGVQCQYPVAEKLKIYAGAGFRLGFPVAGTWKLNAGELEHSGEFPQWGMTIEGKDLQAHDFYVEKIGEDFSKDKHALSLKPFSFSVMADAGVVIPLTEQIDLLAGAYFQVTCNDLSNGERTDIGWQQPDATPAYRQHSFMKMYPENGMIGSTLASNVRPYQVGVKVGVQWHHKEKAPVGPPFYERVETCDTTYTLTQRTDTTYKPQPKVAEQIKMLMQKSVIWFDLDKWEPKLEPADIIDRIAAIMVANPNQKILVNGHASREGQAEHNQMLSDKRAEAVTNLLLEKGVLPEQITTKGYSSEIEYVADDETPEQQEQQPHNIALDRRVEIIPVNE